MSEPPTTNGAQTSCRLCTARGSIGKKAANQRLGRPAPAVARWQAQCTKANVTPRGGTRFEGDERRKNMSDDNLADVADRLIAQTIPDGVDRRTFMMRGAVVSAAAFIAGSSAPSLEQVAAQAPAAPEVPLSADLEVVKKTKGPVMTTVDEFYKVGPGPSSSHTIGPMRITYD